MDWRKLESSYQLPYALSPRRKVVSGFSLGVGASLFVLTVLFLNFSVKSPFLNPMLFQKPRFGGNSSIVSWPFSFASPSLSSSSSSSVTGNGSKSGTSEVKNAVGRVLGKTHEVNATPLGSDGAELGLKEIQWANATSEEVRNENFPSEERKVQDGTHEPKTAEPSKNGNFLDSEKTHLGNTSERGKNGSFLSGKGKITGEIPQGTSIGGHVNESVKVKSAEITENSSDGETRISGNNNVGNLLYNGDHEMAPRTEERDSGTTKMGNFSEKSGTTISSRLTRTGRSSYGSCDIFNGRWVRDDSKPYYPAGSCPYIDRDFDCHLNGRPDDGFVRWRWQPYGCDIPSLNATDFLERLRGKKLVFVGDSLNRNMWESLVCILRHSIRNKKRVYEISGSTDFKKKGVYAFRFEDYNCTVDFVGSPFLVRESSFKGKNGSFETLRLDLMDRTTSMYHDADVVVFNTGHWWTHEKTSKGEDYYQEGNHVHQRLKVLKAYKKALMTWARWIDGNIVRKRTQVFFRGYSVTHFRGGQWNSGGQCHKETEPISNNAYLAKYPSKMRALDHVLQEMRTPVVYLNISRLTDYRKDAHPSIYRKKYRTTDERAAAERSQDCSHWCLPGVPDTWNELLYASLLNVGRGSWRN